MSQPVAIDLSNSAELDAPSVSREGSPRSNLAEDRLRLDSEGFLRPRDESHLYASLTELPHQDCVQTPLQLIHAEALQSAGRMAAAVAHEVRNPLAVVLMGVDYLTKALCDADTSIRGMLQTMREAARRADGIAQGLINVSAPTRMNFIAQDLNSIIEQSLIMVNHELLSRHVVAIQEFGENLPAVRIDGPRMEQVFINLFTNAAYAIETGGTIIIRTYLSGAATGGGDADGQTDCIVIEVDDTGPGIPQDQLAQIFEPFFTTKPPGKGTGLGLSVVRQILTLHGGTIEINNLDGGGARATVTLPSLTKISLL